MENEEEIWKDIPGHEGRYQASSLGRIRSFCRGERILKPCLDCDGYPAITIYRNGEKRTRRIHALMAMAFLGHTPNGLTLVVNHINGNKLKNTLDNIEIVTNRANLTTCFMKNRNTFSSQYVGVCFEKSSNKWGAHILINKKYKNLGRFRSEIDASNAYQNALSKYNGTNR